jgi:hypothetical protein
MFSIGRKNISSFVSLGLAVSLVAIPSPGFGAKVNERPSISEKAGNIESPLIQQVSPSGFLQTESFRISWPQQTWLVPDALLFPNLGYTYLGGLDSGCNQPNIRLALKSSTGRTIEETTTSAWKSSGTIYLFHPSYSDLANSDGIGPYTLQMWVTCNYFDGNFNLANVSQSATTTITFDSGQNPGGLVSGMRVWHRVKGKKDIVTFDWDAPHSLGYVQSDFKFKISKPNSQTLFGPEIIWTAEDYWDLYLPRVQLKRKAKYYFMIATIHPDFGTGQWTYFKFKTR